MSIDRDREREGGGDGERKGAPNVEGLFTLKVDNISFRTTADILREEFKRFGSLGDVYLPRNYSTNEPRGFAFVRFVNREDGEDALRSMDGKNIDGRDIRIQEAKERRAENPKEHMLSRGGYQGGRDRGSERDRGGGGNYGGYREREREAYRPQVREEYRDYGRGGGRERSRERGGEYGRSSRDESPSGRGRDRDREGGGGGRERERERSPVERRRSRSRSRSRGGDRNDRATDRWT